MGNVGLKKPSFCGAPAGDSRSIFKDEQALVRGWQCTMSAHIWKSLVKARQAPGEAVEDALAVLWCYQPHGWVGNRAVCGGSF